MPSRKPHTAKPAVALLAEGVDRNRTSQSSFVLFSVSPSSRRAWIEMQQLTRADVEKIVALLAEGVDRNIQKG